MALVRRRLSGESIILIINHSSMEGKTHAPHRYGSPAPHSDSIPGFPALVGWEGSFFFIFIDSPPPGKPMHRIVTDTPLLIPISLPGLFLRMDGWIGRAVDGEILIVIVGEGG